MQQPSENVGSRLAYFLTIFLMVIQPSVFLPISHLLTSDSTGSSSTLLNARAHAELEESLDDLVKTGALQPTNRMTVDGLLNPVAEQDDMQQYSDKDIYEAVMEAKEQRETAHLHGGEDDIAASLDDTAEPRPSRSEALRAVGLIQKFLAPMDDPFARKLETLLASFGRQTRLEEAQSLTETQITRYFDRASE